MNGEARASDERIEAAADKIRRVLARLESLDRDPFRDCSVVAFLPSEQRLLRDALLLLDPEVKLA